MTKHNNQEDHQNEHIRWLEDELNKVRETFTILAQAISVSKQCTIRWDWDKPLIDSQGGINAINLEDLIKLAIERKYRIISIVVTEYDESGSPLHAVIVALAPEDGNLH